MSLYVRQIDEIGYGKPDVGSRTAGDDFSRRHDNVLRDIRGAVKTIERVDKDLEILDQLKFEQI